MSVRSSCFTFVGLPNYLLGRDEFQFELNTLSHKLTESVRSKVFFQNKNESFIKKIWKLNFSRRNTDDGGKKIWNSNFLSFAKLSLIRLLLVKFIHEKGLLLIFLRRAQTLCTCPVSLIWAFFNSNLPKKLKVEIRKNNIFIDAHIPSWAALNIQREIHSKDLISQNDLTSSFDRFCFVLEIVFLLNIWISYWKNYMFQLWLKVDQTFYSGLPKKFRSHIQSDYVW